jgi:hypothetical protein
MADEKDFPQVAETTPAGSRWLEFLRGSFYKYALAAVLPSFVFLFMFFFVDACLSLLSLPLIAVILFWFFRIKNLWHQIAIGVVALCIATLLLAAVQTSLVSEINTRSADGVLTGGDVAPFRGDSSTVYVFNVTVESNAAVIHAYVNIYGTYMEHQLNLSMSLVSQYVYQNNTFSNYSANTTLASPINMFGFAANTDGTWHSTYEVDGPISSDGLFVFGTLAWTLLIQIFGYCFMQLIIMIMFLRMSAKSKDAREKVMKDYQMKKAQIKGGGPNANVPASGGATGTSPEDTFVCSECGSEVRATAKYCPNCGEPFDEDEEGKPVEPEKKE